jgi:hypothetical protein
MTLLVKSSFRDGLSAVFEDNGRTAYAYLLQGGTPVADVWLYNHVPTPDEPEWRDRRLAPFKNPAGYASATAFDPVARESDVAFVWSDSENSPEVRVYLRGVLHARLVAGAKPGWSLLANADGPLAKMLGE